LRPFFPANKEKNFDVFMVCSRIISAANLLTAIEKMEKEGGRQIGL
jgi:hypothetical protein